MAKYEFPGSYELHRFHLTNFDGSQKPVNIERSVAQLSIFEDLQSNTLQGTIVLYDALDLVQTMPIIGEEKLHIHLVNAGNSNNPVENAVINRIFRVYKISDITREGNFKAQTYKLHFVSVEYFTDVNTSVCKSYKDRLISEMVPLVYDGFIKNREDTKVLLTPEPTIGIQHLVIPMMSPFSAMQFLANRAESSNNPSSTYLFFETHIGFHFTTLEGMLSAKSKDTYVLTAASVGSQLGDGDRQSLQNRIISNMEMVNVVDSLKNSFNGMYGNKITTHDLVTKNIEDANFSLEADWDLDDPIRMSHLNDYRLTSINSVNNTMKGAPFLVSSNSNRPSNEYVTGRETPRTWNTERFLGKQISMFSQFNTTVINVTVPGNTERIPGDIVELDLPAGANLQQLKTDKYLSGKYLVSRVHHKFNQKNYTITLQLLKDSSPVEIDRTTKQFSTEIEGTMADIAAVR